MRVSDSSAPRGGEDLDLVLEGRLEWDMPGPGAVSAGMAIMARQGCLRRMGSGRCLPTPPPGITAPAPGFLGSAVRQGGRSQMPGLERDRGLLPLVSEIFSN